MHDFSKAIGNYVLAFLLLALGGSFLWFYITADVLEPQPVGMLFGALMLLFVGIMSLPFVIKKMDRKLTIVLMIIGVGTSAWLAYLNYETVDEEIVFLENQEQYTESTVIRLKDVRLCQDEYMKYYGRYASDFDSLIAFIQMPIIPIPFQEGGSFLDTIPLKEAKAQGRIFSREQLPAKAAQLGYDLEKFEKAISQNKVPYAIRDTTYSSVWEQNFNPELRKKKNLPALTMEELPYAPFSGQKFILRTAKIDQGGVTLPAVLVQDPAPFGREGLKIDTLRFGSLTESHTNGNWGNK